MIVLDGEIDLGWGWRLDAFFSLGVRVGECWGGVFGKVFFE